MAANFSYKRNTTTSMKVVGTLDADTLVIVDGDGVERNLVTLLSEFDDAYVEVNLKVKEETELDEPIDDEIDA